MFVDEGLEDVEDFFLLPSRQLGDGFEELAGLAFRQRRVFCFRQSQNLFDAHAQGLRHRREHVGAGQSVGSFPKTDVRRVFVDLPGQFAQAQSRLFAERS